MAIYIVCRQNKMDFNQLGVFQFFTQGNGYKSIALKVYQFYNKLNPTLAKEFVEKILPTAKLVGSPLLILQFITLNKLRELDFD